MIEFEKPNIKCLEIDDEKKYALGGKNDRIRKAKY